MIKEIKTIPLESFLSSMGHSPTKRQGTKLWYLSPIRSERTPSFKVDTDRNTWYDFGIGKGGNIIDLAAEIYQSTDIGQLIRLIGTPTNRLANQRSETPRSERPAFADVEILPLQSHALFDYLKERGIPAEIAVAHCREARYTVKGKRYFAIAFPNVSGGHELRNRYFKGCMGRKDVSFLPWARDGPTTECTVFEGFSDYLSALMLDLIPGMDCIVLNSVSNIHKATGYIDRYATIHCYLDTDAAGRIAQTELTYRYGSKVIDNSTLYSNCNDLNEWLQKRKSNN